MAWQTTGEIVSKSTFCGRRQLEEKLLLNRLGFHVSSHKCIHLGPKWNTILCSLAKIAIQIHETCSEIYFFHEIIVFYWNFISYPPCPFDNTEIIIKYKACLPKWNENDYCFNIDMGNTEPLEACHPHGFRLTHVIFFISESEFTDYM